MNQKIFLLKRQSWTWIKFNQFILTNKHVSPSCLHVPAGSSEQVLWVQYALEWQQSKGVTDYGKLSCLKSKFIKLHTLILPSTDQDVRIVAVFRWLQKSAQTLHCLDNPRQLRYVTIGWTVAKQSALPQTSTGALFLNLSTWGKITAFHRAPR